MRLLCRGILGIRMLEDPLRRRPPTAHHRPVCALRLDRGERRRMCGASAAPPPVPGPSQRPSRCSAAMQATGGMKRSRTRRKVRIAAPPRCVEQVACLGSHRSSSKGMAAPARCPAALTGRQSAAGLRRRDEGHAEGAHGAREPDVEWVGPLPRPRCQWRGDLLLCLRAVHFVSRSGGDGEPVLGPLRAPILAGGPCQRPRTSPAHDRESAHPSPPLAPRRRACPFRGRRGQQEPLPDLHAGPSYRAGRRLQAGADASAVDRAATRSAPRSPTGPCTSLCTEPRTPACPLAEAAPPEGDYELPLVLWVAYETAAFPQAEAALQAAEQRLKQEDAREAMWVPRGAANGSRSSHDGTAPTRVGGGDGADPSGGACAAAAALLLAHPVPLRQRV